MHAYTSEIEFVPYIPVRNQGLALEIKRGRDRERNWAVARANPSDKKRGIEAWRVTSYRYLSIGTALERFLGFIGRSKVPSKAILVTRGNRIAIAPTPDLIFRAQEAPRGVPGADRDKVQGE